MFLLFLQEDLSFVHDLSLLNNVIWRIIEQYIFHSQRKNFLQWGKIIIDIVADRDIDSFSKKNFIEKKALSIYMAVICKMMTD